MTQIIRNNKLHIVTTSERNNLSVFAGAMAYDTDLNKFFIHDGTLWLVPGELIRMTNKEGAALSEGHVVKIASGFDKSVEKNASTTTVATIGVVYEGGADGSEVSVAFAGRWKVLCNNVTTVGRNRLLEVQVANDGVAEDFASGSTGAFAVTTETVTSNGADVLVEAILQPTERF